MSTSTVSATVTVTGMTCGHCVSSVREEIGSLSGVVSVDVDLATGKVVIDSTEPLDPSAIAGAVEEAGYTVTDLGDA